MQHYQTLGMLGNFLFCFFFCHHLLSDFIITFKNSIRITIRVSNSFAGLICVQNVCKGYQQMTKVGTRKKDNKLYRDLCTC